MSENIVVYNASMNGLANMSTQMAAPSLVLPIFLALAVFLIAISFFAHVNPGFRKWLNAFLDQWWHYGKNGVYCCVALGMLGAGIWLLNKILTDTGVQETFIKPLLVFFFSAVAISAAFGIAGRVFAIFGIEADKKELKR